MTTAAITVVGSGYVGLVAALCFAEIGRQVWCVDTDADKIDSLRRGVATIHERFLPEMLARHAGRSVRFTTDMAEAVQAAEVVFLAVGTPQSKNGEADLSYVKAASAAVAASIRGYKLIVMKSTIPVGAHEAIEDVILRQGVPPSSFDLASNPEFLREGSAVSDFLHPDRILIGADRERARATLRQIYEPLISGKYYAHTSGVPGSRCVSDPPALLCTSIQSAEIIKHACNAFLATKISFINMVSQLCEAADADIEDVARGMGLDRRIGSRFLRAGVGYGGSCFPKDIAAFRRVGEQFGINMDLLRQVEEINICQQDRFLEKIRSSLGTLRGKRIAVLGLAFKADTDDVRDSPAIGLVSSLLAEGGIVAAYDPAAMPRAQALLPPSRRMNYASTEYEAAKGAAALLVLTDWPQFLALDLTRLRRLMRYPLVLDGRNLYAPESMEREGFIYISIGRTTVSSVELELKEETA